MSAEKDLNILIIEDEPDMAKTLSMLLKRKMSAQSETALDCTAAREKIRSLNFDLITLDYQLPDGDGLSLLQEIVSMQDPPPVVMVTGHGDERTAVEAFKRGASGYVVKDGRIGVMLIEEIKAALLKKDLRRTELELIEKDSMLRHIFESAAEGITIGGPDGTIEYINPASAAFFGYDSPDEMIGTKMADKYADPNDRDKLIGILMETGSVSNYKIKLRHRDGSILNGEINAVLYRDEEGNLVHTLASASLRQQEEEEYKRVSRISEEKYKQMFENMSSCSGILRTFNDGETFVFVDFNRAAEITENLKRADIVGKEVPEIFTGIIEYGLYDIIKRVYKTGEPERFPVSLYSDDRVTGWRSGYVFRVSDDDIVVIYDDTTEQMEAARELEKSNDLLAHIYELAPGAIIVVNSDQVIEFANTGALEALGIDDADDLIGSLSMDWYADPRDRENVLGILFEKGIVRDQEVEVKRADGSKFWARLNVSLEKDENGNMLRFIVLAFDITKQREAEERLRSNEATLHEIYNSVFEAVAVIDKEGVIEYINPAFSKMFGFSGVDELIGVTSERLYADPADRKKILGILLTKGSVQGLEVLGRRKDGSTFWVLVNLTVYRDPSGKMLRTIGFITDISGQKRAEEEVRRVNRELEVYAQNVSHFLKGPLSAIGIAADLLRDKVGDEDGDINEVLNSLENSVELGQERISNLLELAKSGQKPSKVEDLEVRDIIDEVLQVMASRLEARRVELTVDEDLGHIRADRAQMLQIFANLVSNAFKHNDNENPQITISFHGKSVDGFSRYVVHNNGSGIKPDELEKIFAPFCKGKESGGTGLGLPIAEKIAEIYGGNIKAYNNNGASFEVTLKDFPPDAMY